MREKWHLLQFPEKNIFIKGGKCYGACSKNAGAFARIES